MKEEWRDVVGYEGYYKISSTGRLYSIRSKRCLSLTLGRFGYLNVELNVHGKNKRVYIHRLVAMAFIPNPENKKTVNHINSIRSDERVENLEWATQSENILHGFRYGNKDSHGEKHSHNKLTEKQVIEILRIKGKATQQAIADSFNVSRENISRIHRGISWAHIQA